MGAEGWGFQHFQRDLVNVIALKIMFVCYHFINKIFTKKKKSIKQWHYITWHIWYCLNLPFCQYPHSRALKLLQASMWINLSCLELVKLKPWSKFNSTCSDITIYELSWTLHFFHVKNVLIRSHVDISAVKGG